MPSLWRRQLFDLSFWFVRLVACYYGTALIVALLVVALTHVPMQPAALIGQAMADLVALAWIATRGAWGLWNRSPFVRIWREAYEAALLCPSNIRESR